MTWTAIVTRRLQVLGQSRRVVTVDIGQPFQADPEWRCPYRIRGAGLRCSRFACGEDGMQALLLAFVAIRAELDSADVQLAWLSDRSGDVGIPQQAPTHLGFTVQRRVERIMARATQAENRRVIAAGKARLRQRQARSQKGSHV